MLNQIDTLNYVHKLTDFHFTLHLTNKNLIGFL